MDITKEFHDLTKLIEDAGKYAREYFDSPINPSTQKADGTVVTEIDKKIETIIRTHVAERFPDDTIVGEEGDTREGTNGFVWFIDPIDGTDNFVRKIPFFAVTATRLGPTAEDSMAIIHNPISGQTFASLMEDGAYENEHLCNLTADIIGGRTYISVGASSRKAAWVKPARTKMMEALSDRFGQSTMLGSSLLQFAYVSSGRIDANFCFALSPWDSAAGLYVVKAAGGAISVFENGSWSLYKGAIKDLYGDHFDQEPITFVSHQDIHQEILDFVGDPQAWADK